MRNQPDPKTSDADDCGGCSLHDALITPAAMQRREFLRAGGMVLASLGLLGVGGRDAAAMPAFTRALQPASGDLANEKRYAIPAQDGVVIDKDNSVIIARAGSKVYAFSLACPHQNTALRWDEGDKVFACPKHKSHYRPDGTFIDGRATRDMDRLPIRRDGAGVVVNVDDLIQQDENPTVWIAASVSL